MPDFSFFRYSLDVWLTAVADNPQLVEVISWRRLIVALKFGCARGAIKIIENSGSSHFFFVMRFLPR